jgi:hypothetical protein
MLIDINVIQIIYIISKKPNEKSIFFHILYANNVPLNMRSIINHYNNLNKKIKLIFCLIIVVIL